MFGLSPKLQVSEEERIWVDEGFSLLTTLLGAARLRDVKMVEPIPADFPDPYDATEAAVGVLFQRVCAYMKVDRDRIDLDLLQDETAELRDSLRFWSSGSNGCAAGMYFRDPSQGDDRGKMVIALHGSLLREPTALIATIAHELGHAILLGGGLIDPKTPDHEPLTDLLTVFLGFGIFSANSCARFKQFHEPDRQGWSMQRLGYLPQNVYGYALARFATERGEVRPSWSRHLSTSVRVYFQRSSAWLDKNRGSVR